MFKALLYIHILAAVVAFGPSFSIPIMATWIQKNDPSANPYLIRMANVLGRRQGVPASILLLLSGIGMILVGKVPITQFWLALAIGLYVIAFLVGALVQGPASNRMLRLLQGDVEGMGIPADGAMQALMKEVSRSRIVGAILLLFFLTILALMIWKPTI
jgi:uncharacterized membrane protein